MTRQFEITATIVALMFALVGGVVTVESRYAKAQEVRAQLDEMYARQLKLRILEIELKPAPLSSADRALLDHLKQELREATD